MLVLSRRPQQSLLIGHDVIVTVLEVNGDTVRIGIKAPADVDIHREEIYRDLQRANQQAAARPGAAAELARRLGTASGGQGAGGKSRSARAGQDETPDGKPAKQAVPRGQRSR